MKTELLKQLLEQLDGSCYSLGGYREGVYCMQKKGANWEVFYGQNSLHLGSRTFSRQEDANKYFYKMIMEKMNQPIIHRGKL